MALTTEQIEQQKQQAEELLFSGPQQLGFAEGTFLSATFRRRSYSPIRNSIIFSREETDRRCGVTAALLPEQINAAAIDHHAHKYRTTWLRVSASLVSSV